MKRLGILLVLLVIFSLDFFAQGNDQYLVDSKELGSVTAGTIEAALGFYGYYRDYMNINDVTIYKITYNTIDVFGNPTIASGAMYVPQINVKTFPLISWQHGTVMDRTQVPSRRYDDVSGCFYSGNGYITTLPDYLGMGDNPGIHPYIHWESEATASIDLIRAAREFINDSLMIGDNEQIFITGYSQGGHATMAMHKYIQIHKLQDEFNIVASAPMSGPYSLYYDQFDFVLDEDSTYYKSEFLPYIFASYNYVYGNLFTDYSQYYDPPFDSLFAAWDSSGIYFENVSSDIIPHNYYSFMQDSVLNNMKNDPNHPVNVALRKNDLYNWSPQQAIRMLYCGMDSMVTPLNSLTALDTMTALGAPDVQAIDVDAQKTHETCWEPSYLYALEWFDSLAVKSSVHVSKDYESPEIKLYPNPTTNILTIATDKSGQYSFEITSLKGHLIYKGEMEGPTHQIDLSSFPRGVYFVTIRSKVFVSTKKIIKI